MLSINNKSLDRFLNAQKTSYTIALKEIKNEKKVSHWMWYVFPQIKGLGSSKTAQFYAIQDLEEAQVYLLHPILGNRIIEASNTLLKLKTSDPHSVFGSPDDLKLKSSMTLFHLVSKSKNNPFQKVLDKFYNGETDSKTLELINKQEKKR